MLAPGAEFWLDVVRDARIGRGAHVPVAQAFRLEVCSCCGVVTVGAKTLPLEVVSHRILWHTWQLEVVKLDCGKHGTDLL